MLGRAGHGADRRRRPVLDDGADPDASSDANADLSARAETPQTELADTEASPRLPPRTSSSPGSTRQQRRRPSTLKSWHPGRSTEGSSLKIWRGGGSGIGCRRSHGAAVDAGARRGCGAGQPLTQGLYRGLGLEPWSALRGWDLCGVDRIRRGRSGATIHYDLQYQRSGARRPTPPCGGTGRGSSPRWPARPVSRGTYAGDPADG